MIDEDADEGGDDEGGHALAVPDREADDGQRVGEAEGGEATVEAEALDVV